MDKLKQGTFRIPVLAMSATMTADSVASLKTTLGISEFGETLWGKVARRDLCFRVQVHPHTIRPIKKLALKHLLQADGRKVLVFSNSRARADVFSTRGARTVR